MRLRMLALLSLVAGCGAGVAKEGTAETGESAKEESVASGEASRPAARVASLFDGRTHRLVELRDAEGSALEARAARLDVTRATTTILDKYRDRLRMAAPAKELRVVREERDSLGMTHAHFEQLAAGVPVLGASVVAHFDEAGRVTSIDSYYRDGIATMDMTAKVAAKDAESLAAHLALEGREDQDPTSVEVFKPARLVVYAEEGETPVLGWETSIRAVRGFPMNQRFVIDAKTGAVVHRLDNLMSVEGSSPGTLGVARKFEVTQAGNGYQMVDATRSNGIRTYTANNTQTIPGTLVASNSLTAWPAAAVDAHFNAISVYDYFKKTFARNGIDDKGTQIISTVNFDRAYDNAFWDGTQMVYGDGGQLFKPLAAGLDVVAHELTHGVTTSTSNLVYQNQPGAMNEAVSDIFGAVVEHIIAPNPVKNWQVGEDIAKNGVPLRDMKTPKNGQQPAHMNEYVRTTQDNGGVHINSGIPNNAMYLMTVGGTNDVSKTTVPVGIGWDKAAQLWYRANTMYFTTTTDFVGAAQGTLKAAADLKFTQNELNIVECAWIATGVMTGTCKTITATPAGTDGGVGEGGTSGSAGNGSSNPPGSSGGSSSGSASGASPDDDDSSEGTRSGSGITRRRSSSVQGAEATACSAAPGASTTAGAGGFFALALASVAARLRRGRRR